MRWTYFMLISFLVACGGSLNEEQRKQMKEARELQSIKKVSEAEILEAAFQQGREIAERLDSSAIDSLGDEFHVHITWLEPGTSSGSEIERQVIEAYLTGAMMGSDLADNVQKLGNDSLLYSKPVVVELPDGVVEVKGVWNIRISRKQLVLALDKK